MGDEGGADAVNLSHYSGERGATDRNSDPDLRTEN